MANTKRILKKKNPVTALLFLTHASFIPEIVAITCLQLKHETHSIYSLFFQHFTDIE